MGFYLDWCIQYLYKLNKQALLFRPCEPKVLVGFGLEMMSSSIDVGLGIRSIVALKDLLFMLSGSLPP